MAQGSVAPVTAPLTLTIAAGRSLYAELYPEIPALQELIKSDMGELNMPSPVVSVALKTHLATRSFQIELSGNDEAGGEVLAAPPAGAHLILDNVGRASHGPHARRSPRGTRERTVRRQRDRICGNDRHKGHARSSRPHHRCRDHGAAAQRSPGARPGTAAE